ncbi:MAG: hypothetical protein FWG82_05090 [Oscillospiraceae bacterium]|nr:hypothetical protein [Oscillospiraceae bacterium]
MDGFSLTMSVTVIANMIAEKKTNDQLELLVAVLNQLADTLDTLCANRELLEGDAQEDKDDSDDESGIGSPKSTSDDS